MARTATATVAWLTDGRATRSAFAGGKGARLAVMARHGLPVPAGFVVAADAYRRYVEQAGIGPAIAELVAGPVAGASLDGVSATVRALFGVAPFPAELGEEIGAAYRRLGSGPVAVRSSALAEDLPSASFAGQLDSVLNVAGVGQLCEAVRRCWSSAWTARAMAYRERQRIGHGTVAVAVVVQRMVDAEVAGVLFTADPVSGRRDRVVLEAAGGLGDAVVGGRVTPARWIIDAGSRAVLSAPAAGPPLSRTARAELVTLGLRAAELFGGPQDVEWAVTEGRCHLLQSRPITTLFPLPPPRGGLRVYLPLMLIGQGITEPMTPAGNAFFRHLAGDWITHWSGSGTQPSAGARDWLPVLAGRLYADFTAFLRRPRMAAAVASGLGMKDPAAAAALRQWLRANAGRLPAACGLGPARAMAAWLPGVLASLLATLAFPAHCRDRVLDRTERRLAALHRQAAHLPTVRRRLDFVDKVLPGAALDLVLEQVPAVYAELLIRVALQRLAGLWTGDSSRLEPVLRWPPHDPTLAMGEELARLADGYAAAATPAADDPQVIRFLDRFGHRAADREIDLGLPRLADDPRYVVELIEGYRDADGGRAQDRFRGGASSAVTAAAALVHEVRRPAGPLAAGLLRLLLDRHRELAGLRERPKFDMVRVLALGRRVLGDIGEQLAAQGLLDDAHDVYFLDPADIRHGAPSQLRDIAVANRRDYERELRRRAIPRILVSDGEAVYGPAAESGAGDALRGTPVSPGTYEGLARVLDSPVGARLRPGEILVAASTDPGWTPLFLLAGALVMEVGGVISHGAVLAREYGIPAVAGVTGATTLLRTGDRIRVDGNSGTVAVNTGERSPA
ncbi:phosphoenolpyruvate synthase [Catellatospora sp. IY07-71]|uniref:PEP/pyruvate-binding domain-containing protein n=1 Tax=Catellatospora sp. IY07-71 TaxID=2728827 RepID=UPI001BB75682|nr:PEP/pyruvate-binding domain-containing protein [Catellatospora sp. IY07-71]BCJ75837.1 phosphoenolpyruvate synthase [Catellatospora sp. IY07-71]